MASDSFTILTVAAMILRTAEDDGLMVDEWLSSRTETGPGASPEMSRLLISDMSGHTFQVTVECITDDN